MFETGLDLISSHINSNGMKSVNGSFGHALACDDPTDRCVNQTYANETVWNVNDEVCSESSNREAGTGTIGHHVSLNQIEYSSEVDLKYGESITSNSEAPINEEPHVEFNQEHVDGDNPMIRAQRNADVKALKRDIVNDASDPISDANDGTAQKTIQRSSKSVAKVRKQSSHRTAKRYKCEHNTCEYATNRRLYFNRFQCSCCSKHFSRLDELKRQMRTHEKSRKKSQSVKKSHQCNRCNKCFAYKHHLRRHMKVHRDELIIKII